MLRRNLQRHKEKLGIPLLLIVDGKLSANFFPTSENILFSFSCNDTLGNTGLACCIYCTTEDCPVAQDPEVHFQTFFFSVQFGPENKVILRVAAWYLKKGSKSITEAIPFSSLYVGNRLGRKKKRPSHVDSIPYVATWHTTEASAVFRMQVQEIKVQENNKLNVNEKQISKCYWRHH